MTVNDPVSDEQLNALLDNELDDSERARLFDAIRNDESLSARYCKLRQVKELVTLAYNDPPMAANNHTGLSGKKFSSRISAVAAALFLVLVGGVIGWSLHDKQEIGNDSFYTVDRLNPDTLQSKRVLLHLATGDENRISESLSKIEELLEVSSAQHKPIEVEVVANSEGLNILRKGSPFAQRIRMITSRYDNVSFMACGIARHNAELREGKQVALIPEAKEIPAAMERILKRVTGGWSYVRG